MRLLFIALLVFTSVLLAGAESFPARSLYHDLTAIAFGGGLKEVVGYLRACQPGGTKLYKPRETMLELKLKNNLNLKYISKSKANIYDHDFSVYLSRGEVRLSLRQLEDYTPQAGFAYDRWNPLIKKVRFRFHKGKLYETLTEIRPGGVANSLVILSVLQEQFGGAKVKENELQYDSWNRYVWEGSDLEVEYQFYPSRNRYRQWTGYSSKLRISHKQLLSEARAYIIRVKGKIQRWQASL
ncbi:MAG: hypothetical protein OEZ36_01270 [Spirochaetota bacterium]|nr:hypothetical protein [Spirochaetota bacterium]